MHQWNEGWKSGGKIAGFDVDSQSGTQEPQPRHSCCSVVTLALYSPGTLQLHRNNRKGVEEMMGRVYLSRRMKMMTSKISIHDAFCWRKELFLEKKKKSQIPNVTFPLYSSSQTCLERWIWKIITCQGARSQTVPPPTSNKKKWNTEKRTAEHSVAHQQY